jgi:hypothetical protein
MEDIFGRLEKIGRSRPELRRRGDTWWFVNVAWLKGRAMISLGAFRRLLGSSLVGRVERLRARRQGRGDGIQLRGGKDRGGIGWASGFMCMVCEGDGTSKHLNRDFMGEVCSWW